jgi:RNA polymerase sigma-70 factor, ECF subfamily
MMESAVSTPTRKEPDQAVVNVNRHSRSGDFEELMLPHLGAAYNLARWLMRNGHDAEDVVQDAYLRAFRFFDGYRGGDAKAWLLEIVRNTCFTWLRRETREAAVPFDEATASIALAREPEADIESEERRAVLRNCIELLPEAFREVLVMRELEEMSYRQISEVVSLPVGTVMSRLSRARKRLTECVAGRRVRASK